MSAAAARISIMLSVKDTMTLDFEAHHWKYVGAKEATIRELFTESATRYYQRLNALIDRPEALAYDPLLVKRLQRMREARRRHRTAIAAGFDT
jgi:hypothetical protein